VTKLRGIKIPGFSLGKDGKIFEDIEAKRLKLDVSTRIAAKAKSETKIRYGKPLLRNPRREAGE
jgi:hypothetical protein